MSGEDHDLIIVGAGIHGAGIALAATDQGRRCLLIEKDRVAGATSSRSSKLIHGGLRYLESMQFSLVRECLRERNWLLEQMPELVRAVPFFIPVYRDSHRRPWQIRAGLSLYSLLSGRHPCSRFRSIPPPQWPGLDGLRLRGLQRVYQYWDGQTDDAALTRAVLDQAMARGAELAMPQRVRQVELQAGQVLVHTDVGSHRGRMLINAAGPWVNELLALCTPEPVQRPIDLVQGTHVLLPGKLHQGIYYLESPTDRRAIFAMPWQGRTLLGTTETPHLGPADDAAPLASETEYLLDCFMHYFPDDPEPVVLESFAGLRVLPKGEGSAFNRPRETVILRDPRYPVVSIYGGKLTAFRATARKVLEQCR